MKLIAVDRDGTHCYAPEDCTVTEEEIERKLRLSHDSIYWFAKALRRLRPAMNWTV